MFFILPKNYLPLIQQINDSLTKLGIVRTLRAQINRLQAFRYQSQIFNFYKNICTNFFPTFAPSIVFQIFFILAYAH